MRCPTYLEEVIASYSEVGSASEFCLNPSEGGVYEIWHNGTIVQPSGKEQSYITPKEHTPLVVKAIDSITKHEIILLDSYNYGYKGMFCTEPVEPARLAPKNYIFEQYESNALALFLTFFYNTDYEEKRNAYKTDSEGNITLCNGNNVSWEELEQNGYNAVSFSMINEKAQDIEFVQLELA